MPTKIVEGVAGALYVPLAARVYVSQKFPECFFDPKSLKPETAIPGNSIQTGCELLEVQPLYANARCLLEAKIGL